MSSGHQYWKNTSLQMMCDSASIFRSEVSRMRIPFGWQCCTRSTRYRSSLRTTWLGQQISCFIGLLPNSNWARPASISFRTLTGIFWYYPYIHLEGTRKPRKSLNITCKQAVLLQIFVPCCTFLHGYVSIKYWSIVLMYPVTYFNSTEIKSAQRNFTKCLFFS